jgi:4-hydroxybenzoate polyprenyltransferase
MIIQFSINYYVVCLSERDRENPNLKRPGPSRAVELKKKRLVYIIALFVVNMVLI